MMFWFNKWYSKQRTDYNIVVRLIIILGSRLPDSHSPSSALAHSRFSTHTLRLLTKLIPHGLASLCLFLAPPRMCSAKARSQGHVDLFYETIHLKDRRHIEPSRLSRHCLWFDRYLRPFVHDTTYIYMNCHPLTSYLLHRAIQKSTSIDLSRFFRSKEGKLLRFDNAIAFTYCDILSFLCIVRGLFAVQLNHGIPKQYYRHFWTTFRWVSFEVLATAELSRNLYTFEMKFCALLRVVSEHVGSFWTSGRYEEKGSVYKADSTFLVNFPLNLKEILVSSYLLQSDTSQHFVIGLLALLNASVWSFVVKNVKRNEVVKDTNHPFNFLG